MNTATSSGERAVLIHGTGFELGPIRAALESESVRTHELIGPLDQLESGDDAPTVVIIDDETARREPDLRASLSRLSEAVAVIAAGEEAARRAEGSDRVFLSLPVTPDPETTLRLLQAAFRHAAVRLAAGRARDELRQSRSDLRELNQIGMALMTERDPDQLLHKILDRSMRMTGSDAGSLYLVESDERGQPRLRFKLAENASLPELPFQEFTLPIDRTSMAGYAADTNEPLLIDDAYHLPETSPYSFNRSFDERFGYRTKSVLIVPMADHKDEVVGVIQLINRKRDSAAAITSEEDARDWVVPYGRHELALVRGLAGQAAVSIENARLYEQIEHIFESFVKAAVAAIDQRDPTTAGHSVRVATLTTDLAGRLPRLTTGRWAGFRLTRDQMKELRYAALLHDFGKVGVREEVLVKAKKLPPYLWERVQSRFDLIHRTIEKEYIQRKFATAQQHEMDGVKSTVEALDEEMRRKLEQLRVFRGAIEQANEPSILPEEGAAVLKTASDHTFEAVTGESEPYIRDEELAYLSIPKGSLDERERREIESHVTQTYKFLTQIPWTDDLQNVAEIAYGHHEKLDGRGYPRGVQAEQIPVQTRIMTISDIFDALTASDRPYKRALGPDRALDILRMEAKDGMLDNELVELLIESKVYETVLEHDWREL